MPGDLLIIKIDVSEMENSSHVITFSKWYNYKTLGNDITRDFIYANLASSYYLCLFVNTCNKTI